MSEGWIKLHRQIQECEIWDSDSPFDERSAWIDLLLLVNHRDKKTLFDKKPITVLRGQRITSIRKLAERWRWSFDRTRRYLILLEQLGMIKRESDNKRSLITIVNYSIYQDETITDEFTERSHISAQTDHRQVHRQVTNKNEKNEKNEKKYYEDENLNQSFLDYIKMRKDIKKPMSDRAITLAMNKLDELSGGDDETAIQILEQSIFHSWQGLFELKNEPKKVPQYKQFAHRDDGLTDLERELISN